MTVWSYIASVNNLSNIDWFKGLSCEKWTPIFSSPGPNTSKYLDPQIIYFNCVETFGAPEQKCLINLDPFEYFNMP